jgi:hypothetical protein
MTTGGKSPSSIFLYLTRLLPVLLGWSVASLLAGAWLRRKPGEHRRGVADQFLAWGALDGLIAAGGIAGSLRSNRQLQAGEISPAEHAHQARRFEQVVWANAALDTGYMASGAAMIRRNADHPYRRGTGWGILLQGAFLFAWDLFLALAIRSYRRDRIE